MAKQPVVARESDREWETWPPDEIASRGRVSWKTLFSGDITPTEGLTFGIAAIPRGDALALHRHAQAEIYFVLDGVATVTVESEELRVEAGAALFVPGNALHGCRNLDESELRLAYVFPADSFDDVEYVFPEEC